jgi:hypothetical protein
LKDRHFCASFVNGKPSIPMPQSFDHSEEEFRAYRLDYLRRWFPNHDEEIALGEELLAFASDRTNELTHEIHRRFWTRHVALMGDSACGIRFGTRDGDLVCHPAYIRISIYPGDPPKPPHCVHYLACVRGTVAAISPEFGVIGLMVAAEDYHITETF